MKVNILKLTIVLLFLTQFQTNQAFSVTAPQVASPIGATDPRVSHSFSALGSMYEINTLIWSGVHSRVMNRTEASRFCASLGEGARLPSLQEYLDLKPESKAVLIAGADSFWSSTIWGDNLAYSGFVFRSAGGFNYELSPESKFSFRCVLSDPNFRNSHITQLRLDSSNEHARTLAARIQHSKPAFFDHDGKNGILYLINDPEARVAPFVLGDQSGSRMFIHEDAAVRCRELGGEVPAVGQGEALSRAMTQNGIYNQHAIAGLGMFWTATPGTVFLGGRIEQLIHHSSYRYMAYRVRCVLNVSEL